jgi:flagellar hook protein FlgE
MLVSLDSGASALEQFQQDLNVIGNNIANVDTVGYKSSSMNFADTFSQTLGSSAAGTMQVGTGVETSDIETKFTEGTLSSTGVASNLAINGNGFFLVQDPATGTQYVTRDGDFSVDTSGNLITSNGMQVMGFSGSSTTPTALNVNNGADTSGMDSYNFSGTGKLTVTYNDGTQAVVGQVALQNCSSPNQLVNVGNNLFSNLSAAGPLTAAVAPGASGTGTLTTSSLEESNVDLSGELTDLIVAQRAYEANAKVITTSDQVLQDLTNLGR